MERTDEDLRSLSTPHLVRQALEEVKLLAKAEVLHAKAEVKAELNAAKLGGALLGGAAVLALTSLSVLFVMLAIALPLSDVAGLAVVGLGLLLIAGVLGFVGFKALPKKPLPRTQERLKTDITLAREQFQ